MSIKTLRPEVSGERDLGEVRLEDLNHLDHELLEAAQGTRRNAYAPYSKFSVGAAVRTESGAIYSSANMESASYGLTLCAEACALSRAVSEGDFRVSAIAVVGGPLGKKFAPGDAVTPCGRCRQLIFEAGQVSGLDIRVLSANSDFSKIFVARISSLLPYAFGPKNLKIPLE
ncbi:MAG TPA: cytidine deaminase [Verrucomicrobiae bacterium]|nr:cytidine deaminase [Verrucomicrobiae bacterium]